MTKKFTVITASGSWTVPPDWNNANNKIECIGGGSKGAVPSPNTSGGGGGGGGAYAAIVNQTYTPGHSITVTVGVAGDTSADAGNTSVKDDANSTTPVLAQGAQSRSGANGGTDPGLASASTGSTKFSGGFGGASATSAGNSASGGGGGGAGGPTSAGSAGGAGASGGLPGPAGGAGGSPSGGTAGTGGNPNGGAGGAGTGLADGVEGAGGGGGGGQGPTAAGNGGDGGLYGSGGGGGGDDAIGPSTGTNGVGKPGVIVISWEPLLPQPIMNRQNDSRLPPPSARAKPALFSITALALALTQVVAPPSKPRWDNPVTRSVIVGNLTWTQGLIPRLVNQDKMYGAAGQVADYDWPNPRGPQASVSLRTHIDPLKLELRNQDKMYGAAGQVADYDNPLPPRGPARSVDLLTLITPPTRTVPPAPFAPTDWPVPRAAPRAVSLLTWSQSGALTTPDGLMPASATGWFNPPAPTWSTDLRTWLQSPVPVPPTSATPFSQSDWPVPPRAAPRSVDLLSFVGRVTAGPPTPFAQNDWPVPRGPSRVVDLLTTTASSTEARFPGSGIRPFAQSDWQNPRGAARSVDLLTYVGKVIVVPAIPFAQNDWPVPRGAQRSVDLLSWLWQPTDLLPFGSVPFAQSNWPVPRGPTAAIDLRTWSSGPSLSAQAPVINYIPSLATGWMNPAAARPSDVAWAANTPITLIAPPSVKPAGNTEWPVPRSPIPAIDLRTWINSSNALTDVTYTFREPIGFRTWRVDSTVAVNTGTRATPVTLIAPPQPVPFNQSDWPLPRAPGRSVDLLTWTVGASEAALLPQGAVPFSQTVWPVPAGPVTAISLRTWIVSVLPIGSPSIPVAQTDWPLPRRAAPAVGLLTWVTPPIQATPSPFAQLDWQNPRKPASSQLGFVSPTNLALNVVPANRPRAQYDWPVPAFNAPQPRTFLYSWTQRFVLRTPVFKAQTTVRQASSSSSVASAQSKTLLDGESS